MEAEKRQPNKTYANYMKYYVQAYPSAGTFDCGYEGRGAFLQGVRAALRAPDGTVTGLSGKAVATDW